MKQKKTIFPHQRKTAGLKSSCHPLKVVLTF